MRISPALLLLLGCSEPEPQPSGARRAAVVETLLFARDREPGVSLGFDLDGHVSADGDAQGCGHADRTTPDGLQGVDNAFAGLLPVLEATEASAIEDLIGDAIAAGDLLLLFEVSGLDDPVDDDCVELSVHRASGQPLLAPDGTLLDGQTFDTDPDPARIACAELRDGVIEAGPLALSLQIQILDVALDLEMEDARVSLTLEEGGGMSGYFGGAVPLEGILKIVEEDDLADLRELVTSLVTLAADLQTAPGECGALSITFEHRSVEAFRYR